MEIEQLGSLPPRPNRAARVCVSGGIGCGKSLLVSYLRDCGGVIFDADAVSRQLTAPGGLALPAIREAFGQQVFTATDELDRQALARIVFADSQQRLILEAIVHPLIWARFDELQADLSPDKTLVAEIPIAAETGKTARYDLVVMVDAPLELRLKRLERRGMKRPEALCRIAAQADEAARRSIANLWITNDRDDSDALRQLAKNLWEDWLGPRGSRWI